MFRQPGRSWAQRGHWHTKNSQGAALGGQGVTLPVTCNRHTRAWPSFAGTVQGNWWPRSHGCVSALLLLISDALRGKGLHQNQNRVPFQAPPSNRLPCGAQHVHVFCALLFLQLGEKEQQLWVLGLFWVLFLKNRDDNLGGQLLGWCHLILQTVVPGQHLWWPLIRTLERWQHTYS